MLNLLSKKTILVELKGDGDFKNRILALEILENVYHGKYRSSVHYSRYVRNGVDTIRLHGSFNDINIITLKLLAKFKNVKDVEIRA